MYAQDRRQPTCCSQVGHLDAKFLRVYCSGPVSVNSSHLKRVREVGCFHMWLFSQAPPGFPLFFTPRLFFCHARRRSSLVRAYGRGSDLRTSAAMQAQQSARDGIRCVGPRLGAAPRFHGLGYGIRDARRGLGLTNARHGDAPLGMRHPPKHRAHPQRPPSMVPPSRARATGSRVPVAPRRRSLPLALRQAPSRCQLQPSLERPSTHSRAAGDST